MSAIGNFVSGAAEQADPRTLLEGLWSAVRHPIDTSIGLATAQVDQFKQSKKLYDEGRYMEAFGHALAGALPIMGPQAAKAGETIASGDVARGLGQATGLAALSAPSVITKPFNAIRQGAVTGARAAAPSMMDAAADSLSAGAKSRVVDVIAPKGASATVKRMGGMADKHAQTVLDEMSGPAPKSRQGMFSAVQEKLDAAEAAMDAAADLQNKGAAYPTAPVRKALLEAKRALTAEAVEGSRMPPSLEPVGAFPARGLVSRSALDSRFPKSPDSINGTSVTKNIPNRASIESSLDDYEVLPGVRQVQVSDFENSGPPQFASSTEQSRTAQLAQQIKQNKSLDPLIVVVDGEHSPYILEGSHRFNAIKMNGETSFPALVVVDTGSVAYADHAPVARPIGEDVIPKFNHTRVSQIDAALGELNTLGPMARYDALKKIRQSYDQAAKAKYSPSLTSDFMTKQGEASGAADVTRAFREHLATLDPNSAKANSTYHVWKSLDDVMSAAEEIQRVKPNVGRQMLAKTGGAVVGEAIGGVPGMVAGYFSGGILDKLLSSGPTTQLMTAKAMDRLAKALKSGAVPTIQLELKKLRSIQAIANAQKSPANKKTPEGDIN